MLVRMARVPKSTSDPLLHTLAENVRRLLEHHKWSQVEAAKQGFLDQSQVSKILHGVHAPDTDTLARVALTFRVPAYQLLVPHLNPSDPPELLTLKALERRIADGIEERWEQISAELKAQLRVPSHDETGPKRPSAADPFPALKAPRPSQKGRTKSAVKGAAHRAEPRAHRKAP